MKPTQRTFINHDTREVFRLYNNDTTGKFCLISETTGQTSQNYYATAFDVEIKLNTLRKIRLCGGEFYAPKQGETITHKRIVGFKNFVKI